VTHRGVEAPLPEKISAASVNRPAVIISLGMAMAPWVSITHGVLIRNAATFATSGYRATASSRRFPAGRQFWPSNRLPILFELRNYLPGDVHRLVVDNGGPNRWHSSDEA